MEWSLVYVVDGDEATVNPYVLLVEKNRPTDQKGKYNLIGGKIENGETPQEAGIREMMEETGLKAVGIPEIYGTIGGSWGKVHCMKAITHDKELRPRKEETEKVSWHEWKSIKGNKKLMRNLRIIIPLFMCGITGWTITGESDNSAVSVDIKDQK